MSAWNQTSPPQRSGKNNLPPVFRKPSEQARPVPVGQRHRGNVQLPQLRLEGQREISRAKGFREEIPEAECRHAPERSAQRAHRFLLRKTQDFRGDFEEIFRAWPGGVHAPNPEARTLHRLPLPPRGRNRQREVSRRGEKFQNDQGRRADFLRDADAARPTLRHHHRGGNRCSRSVRSWLRSGLRADLRFGGGNRRTRTGPMGGSVGAERGESGEPTAGVPRQLFGLVVNCRRVHHRG